MWLSPLVATILAGFFTVKVKTDDAFWHMATGRWIVEHRTLPTVDPFTYTMTGKPWHLVNGLADVILYLAYWVGAESGLVAIKVAAAWLVLCLAGFCLRAVNASSLTTVSLVTMLALLLHGRFTMERPLIFGGVLLAACQLAAIRSHRKQDNSSLVFLIALPIWPLVHGTALLGAGVLVSLIFAAVVTKAPKPYLKRIAVVGGVSLLVSLATPWWRDLFLVASEAGSGSTATSFTAEWESGVESFSHHVGHWIVVVGAMAGGVSMFRSDPGLLAMSALGAVISLRFGRNSYEAVILCLPAFACGIGAARRALELRALPLFSSWLAPLCALAVCAIQLALSPFTTVGGPFGVGLASGFFPTDTLATLNRLPKRRVLNDFPIGGYLIWKQVVGGVYCDGRTMALFREADVQELFVPLLSSSAAITASADKWDAVYGLAQNMSIPAQWMMVSPDWVPLHIGDGTSLFVRASFLAEIPPGVRPLPLLRFTEESRWVDFWYRNAIASEASREELKAQMTEACRLSPFSPVLANIVFAVARIDPAFGGELADIIDRARVAKLHCGRRARPTRAVRRERPCFMRFFGEILW